MALPPLWKIRRELNRIRIKAQRLAGRTFYDPLRKPIYDRTSHWWQRVTPGQSPLTDRVAVFVVYQPKGLAQSILLTLGHLRRNDYSVLLVSNGALRPEDRATLAANCALLMERPNVGYDFGAYRDGIRHLWSLKHDLSRLILMNDSTWFPLRRDDDSLARMEALGADLAGHIFKTESDEKRGNDHVEAHLMMVSKGFFQSGDFRHFWSDYQMSNRRDTTVQFGEKGFSQLALCNGWRVETLMGREWLIEVLRELDDDTLKAVCRHTVDNEIVRKATTERIPSFQSSEENFRDAFISWTDKSLRSSGVFFLSATYIMPALVYGGMAFAKKSADIRFQLARKKLLELDAARQIAPLDDIVRTEIVSAVASWQLMKSQEIVLRASHAERMPAG